MQRQDGPLSLHAASCLNISSAVLVAEQRSLCAAQEFGLPSSHTMNTLCLQFYLVHYLIEHELVSNSTAGKQRARLRQPLTGPMHSCAALMLCTPRPCCAAGLYTLVTAWVVFIAASRLYLGLHTPIDILAGAVAGLAVVTCFIGLEGERPSCYIAQCNRVNSRWAHLPVFA
jgi:sphingosine-1-phosphate phosphatase 1